MRPRVADIRLRLAESLREVGEHVEAVQSYQRALAFKASLFEGWIGLGLSNMALERWIDAVSSLRNAVSLRPTSASAHAHLSEALRQSGQADDAARHRAVATALEIQ